MLTVIIKILPELLMWLDWPELTDVVRLAMNNLLIDEDKTRTHWAVSIKNQMVLEFRETGEINERLNSGGLWCETVRD